MSKSYNPIYRAVFDTAWTQKMLGDLRPSLYAEALQAWHRGEHQDSFLLRGTALQEAEAWAAGKQLSLEDEDFLLASRTAEGAEMRRKLAAEAKANQILATARDQAEHQLQEATEQLRGIEAEKHAAIQEKEAANQELTVTKRQTRRWAFWGVIAAVGITGALTWAGIQTKTVQDVAKHQVEQANQTAQGKIDQANHQAQQIQANADRVKLQADRDIKNAQGKVTQAQKDLDTAKAAKAKADAEVAAAHAQVAQAQGQSQQIQLEAQRNLDEAQQKQAAADRQVDLAAYKLAATNTQVTVLNSQAAYSNNDTLQAMMLSLGAGAQYKAIAPKGQPQCSHKDEKTQSLCQAYDPLMAALQQVLYSDKGLNTNRLEHQGSIYSVSFSPDGETIATGSFDNTGCGTKTAPILFC